MQFFKPEYFTYLWLVPAVFILFVMSRKLWQKRLARLIQDKDLLQKLLPGYRNAEWLARTFLVTFAVLFMVLALARPQWGDEKKSLQRKGVDLIFMVDTSLSMLAEDIKPSRIGKAKFEIESFVRSLRGDRVGMVTFAGSGFLQTPLTLDHAAFLLFLDAVQVGFLPDPGTSLSQAIHLAIRAFPQKELKYKALILLTDGEDHEGGIEQGLEEAKKANVRIYTIGLGTTEGEPIPLKNEKGERAGFKKDRAGQMVISKLNQPLLERIAKETGGIYMPGTPGEKEVDYILRHLRNWGEQQFAEKTVVEKEDQYQAFLMAAFFLLIAEMLIRRRSRKGTALAACILAFFLFTGFFETSQQTIKKGNEDFQNKKYQSALESYRKVQVKNPDAPELLYDLGTALYKVDSFQESSQNLEGSVLKAQDSKLKAQALYNYGNAQYRLGNFEKAIDSYKKVLEIDPSDQDAKYNLEFLQKQKSQFEKKDQERKKENQKKQDQQQQQNQNQQQQQGQGSQQDQKQQDQQGQQGQQDQQDKDQQQDQQSQIDIQPNQQEQGQQGQQEEQQAQQQKQKEQEQKEKELQELLKQQEEQKKQQEQEQKLAQQADQKPDPNEKKQGQPRQPLQGQMSMENALNLLDALHESERELQDLRRPPVNRNQPPVDKDW